MAGGRASLFWPLLPKMEEQVLRYNRQMCNTSCEEWWGGRGPAKFVVLCGMVPGQFPLASQKQPALHKNTSCLSSTQESTFLPVSYTTMAFSFPCMPCLAPFLTKNTPKDECSGTQDAPDGSCHRVLKGQGWHQGEHKTPPVSSQAFKLKSEATGVLQRCHP